MIPLTRRTLLAASGAAAFAPRVARAAALPAMRIALWPGAAPGMGAAALLSERITERSTDPALRDRALDRIRTPCLDVFPAVRPNGAAVLIMPGGGYQRVVIDREGHELAAWLAERGVTAFVLFYRLPAEGWDQGRNVPLADAQRAMRLIRGRAADYAFDPARVAALGFSAGGHLCADLATRFGRSVYSAVDTHDALSARPALAAPIYPVISMDPAIAHPGSRERLIGATAGATLEEEHSPDLQVTAATPPLFLVHAEDDAVVPVDNSLRLRSAARAASVSVDTHLFSEGGHGFGLRLARGKPVENWPELFLRWAGHHGLLG